MCNIGEEIFLVFERLRYFLEINKI